MLLLKSWFLFSLGYVNNDAGASHGGEGGQDGSNNRALPYDNFMEPAQMGTGCGSVKGGGFLKLKAENTLDLQGIVTAKYELLYYIKLFFFQHNIQSNLCLRPPLSKEHLFTKTAPDSSHPEILYKSPL